MPATSALRASRRHHCGDGLVQYINETFSAEASPTNSLLSHRVHLSHPRLTMSNDSHDANVIRGHKAAMHNPRVSDEAKERSRQVVESYEKGSPSSGDETVHEHRVLGGYKATLTNPNTSDEAKEHAKEVLEENGVQV
ncbi:hypothetical protein AURDEDRAFT_70157 [Auricularia subglabra TFB-10046 SS5]|nr:hypothetical protein AURDEDRAFT_70157 [Auricularia subglabra TFB-10046 SS5]